MNILEVYKKYQIMPQLEEHQLRVAAVADLICDSFNNDVDRENIIKACLLHDIGNIVKFDFTLFPEIAAEKGLEYWQNIKREFMEKYGTGSHNVTIKILKEISVSQRILELANCVGFEQGKNNAESQDFGKKICAYSDMRVGPFGVVSLAERMADLRTRYRNHSENAKHREVFEQALREIEKQIFAKCKIPPGQITDESIEQKLEKLRTYEI